MSKTVKQYKRITLYFDEKNKDQMAIYNYVLQRSEHYHTPSLILNVLKHFMELEKTGTEDKEKDIAERIADRLMERLPDLMKNTGHIAMEPTEDDSALADLDNDFGITEY